ncbi:alpha/beta fold hydrolase [Crocosphaera watsonii]|uniref:Alpha/beta hydrolase fold n=1 Tax=Crocosphaera watsonii WH 0401 TaxID=555881 RepID=T2JD82_CROWT|nr:alpha/beta hydrolase [Crocosphaera watsonii]CCQ63195.1 Alpha/beta hydrolase fold [Crocosphaera watsonii WH 0401]
MENQVSRCGTCFDCPHIYPQRTKKDYQAICETRQAILTQPTAVSFLKDRLNPEDAVDTVENHIHQIEVPTLVIAAECDSHIPRWHCEVYRDKIPNAQLSIIPNGDHDFVQTHSHEISNLLKIHWSELINLA